jgi:uncharacterized protein (DUF2249 family)
LGHRLPDAAAGRKRKGDEMITEDRLLDIRSEAPARRHSLIFQTYAGLGRGEAFLLVNDHDPIPFYYQFAAENPGRFAWDYLENGPETWPVRIGRASGDASEEP